MVSSNEIVQIIHKNVNRLIEIMAIMEMNDCNFSKNVRFIVKILYRKYEKKTQTNTERERERESLITTTSSKHDKIN